MAPDDAEGAAPQEAPPSPVAGDVDPVTGLDEAETHRLYCQYRSQFLGVPHTGPTRAATVSAHPVPRAGTVRRRASPGVPTAHPRPQQKPVVRRTSKASTANDQPVRAAPKAPAAPAAAASRPAKVCKSCGTAIIGAGAFFGTDSWHLRCFRCTVCNELVESEFAIIDGKPVHGNCLAEEEDAPAPPSACSACNCPIEETDSIVIDGALIWHMNCLKCYVCGSIIEAGFRLHGDRPFHPDCVSSAPDGEDALPYRSQPTPRSSTPLREQIRVEHTPSPRRATSTVPKPRPGHTGALPTQQPASQQRGFTAHAAEQRPSATPSPAFSRGTPDTRTEKRESYFSQPPPASSATPRPQHSAPSSNHRTTPPPQRPHHQPPHFQQRQTAAEEPAPKQSHPPSRPAAGAQDCRTHYEVLQVSAEATESEITKAYRKLVLQCHPDRNPDGEEEFKKVQLAKSILLDPAARTEYDLQLRLEAVRLRAARTTTRAYPFPQYTGPAPFQTGPAQPPHPQNVHPRRAAHSAEHEWAHHYPRPGLHRVYTFPGPPPPPPRKFFSHTTATGLDQSDSSSESSSSEDDEGDSSEDEEIFIYRDRVFGVHRTAAPTPPVRVFERVFTVQRPFERSHAQPPATGASPESDNWAY